MITNETNLNSNSNSKIMVKGNDLQKTMVVSLIGRPNVGKSSIFNRILKNRSKAITFDRPGVTRDRHYAIAGLEDYANDLTYNYVLVDTGGFYPQKVEEKFSEKYSKDAEPFFNLMADQAKIAIDESDLVLFVLDIRDGLNPIDEEINRFLRMTKKPVWGLINKYDSVKQSGDEYEFYKLSLDKQFLLSAEHGVGIIELEEAFMEFFRNANISLIENNDEVKKELERGVTPRHDVVASAAIIGAPNVGKSTLLNQLVGATRSLVSPVAGTTADSIESYISLDFEEHANTLAICENEFEKLKLEREKFLSGDIEEIELDEINKEISENILNSSKKIDIDFSGYEIDLAQAEQLEPAQSEEADDEEIDFDYSENTIDHYEEEEEFRLEENLYESKKIKRNFRSIKLTDTAGIRKQKLVEGPIEERSVYRSLRAINESDVVICLIDVTKGFTHHDRRLCDIAIEKGKSVILTLNKIDLMPEIFQDKKAKKEWLLDLQAQIPWLSFCEIIYISAKNRTSFKTFKKALIQTITNRKRVVKTGELNRLIQELIFHNTFYLPFSRSGNEFKVKYASMVKSDPPTFILFCNGIKGIPDNFRKYLVNNIRKHFNFVNTPVHLIFRKPKQSK